MAKEIYDVIQELQQSGQPFAVATVVETALAGWTPLGMYELQRKRERVPLAGGVR